MERLIYADYAATAPLLPQVTEAMMPFFLPDTLGVFGNPSSLHRPGRQAFAALSDAREKIASLCGCEPDEIVFTSGATEADNLAIKGVSLFQRHGHIVTTAIEHPAVLRACDAVERTGGITVTRVPPSSNGRISDKSIASELREETFLVAVMAANNETGVINDIPRIAEAAHKRGCLFFTDAVQRIPFCHPKRLIPYVDLLSLSGHKLGAPKGTGLLYVRRGTPLLPLFDGGGQEGTLRSGTENVPGIVGLAAALEEAVRNLPGAEYVSRLRNRLEEGILSMPGTKVNGSEDFRLPGHLNVTFRGVSGETLMHLLAARGIAVSTASACTASSASPSHVLLAMRRSEAAAMSSIRFSLSYGNSKSDVDAILAVLSELLPLIRAE